MRLAQCSHKYLLLLHIYIVTWNSFGEFLSNIYVSKSMAKEWKRMYDEKKKL